MKRERERESESEKIGSGGKRKKTNAEELGRGAAGGDVDATLFSPISRDG